MNWFLLAACGKVLQEDGQREKNGQFAREWRGMGSQKRVEISGLEEVQDASCLYF